MYCFTDIIFFHQVDRLFSKIPYIFNYESLPYKLYIDSMNKINATSITPSHMKLNTPTTLTDSLFDEGGFSVLVVPFFDSSARRNMLFDPELSVTHFVPFGGRVPMT
jgi:hypothetical protein